MLSSDYIRSIVRESIKESYQTILFENFGLLEDTLMSAMDVGFAGEMVRDFEEVVDAATKAVGFNSMAMDAEEYVQEVVEIYRTLVKRGVKFVDSGGREVRQGNDSSFWIGQLNRNMDMRSVDRVVSIFCAMLVSTMRMIKERKDFKDNKESYKIIHKGSNFTVFKPEHKAAACRLGANTKWCISARGSDNYFDDYNARGEVYIIHTRNDKYAIIMADGRVKEIQHSGNTYDEQNYGQYEEFVSMMRGDGVDLELLDSLIGSNLSKIRKKKEFRIESMELIGDLEKNMAVTDTLGFDDIENFYLSLSMDGETHEVDGIIVAKKASETFMTTIHNPHIAPINGIALELLPKFNDGRFPDDNVMNKFSAELRKVVEKRVGDFETVRLQQFVKIAEED